jgi:hypothetical protein
MRQVLHKIEVTCALEMNARDIELLECLTSYDNNAIVEAIMGEKEKGHSVSYNGGVKFDELVTFLNALKAHAGAMKTTINSQGKNIIR